MENITQIKEVIKTITKTITGIHVRGLLLYINKLIITGEILFPGDTEWSTGQWTRSGKWFTLGTPYKKTGYDNIYNLDIESSIHINDRKSVIKKHRDVYKCCYCTKYITKRFKTWEHLIPISRGGSDNPKNKRICCRTCNLFRGNQPLDKWKTKIEVLIAMNMGYRNHSVDYLKIIIRNIPIIQKDIDNATPDMYGLRKIEIYKNPTPKSTTIRHH